MPSPSLHHISLLNCGRGLRLSIIIPQKFYKPFFLRMFQQPNFDLSFEEDREEYSYQLNDHPTPQKSTPKKNLHTRSNTHMQYH